MKIKTLKNYQEQAMQNALHHYSWAQQQYAALPDTASAEERRGIASHQGCLLLEAPTGSGKTLMAAHLVETFSAKENVVWFWFAPFKGVVGQTVSFLKTQCAGLRVRDLTTDREISGSRSGDVFVTTWQTVAVKAKEKRTARNDSEMAAGTDTLVAELRKMGYQIGVVVDEAHHSFQGQSQAAAFYKDVLVPEYTVLITATPDDKDITKWKAACGIENVHRIAVSRADAVAAGLVKNGVKCISFMPDAASAGLVDLEMTCLRCAKELQDDLKEKLQASKISLTPLLMVQVDSKSKDAAARAKAKLLQCGYAEEAIRIHTADEPDQGLETFAKDESVEVLIFKMAVALGFDAPRAFTLVSMRSAKDEDFGVQLLGRILRVHGKLQGKSVPDALNYGYVLLANPAGQEGLQAAGVRMNAMKTEMDKTAPTVAVVCVGGQNGLQLVGPGGQTTLFPTTFTLPVVVGGTQPPGTTVTSTSTNISGNEQIELTLDGGTLVQPPTPTASTPGFIAAITSETVALAKKHRYALRPEAPKRFVAITIPDDVEDLEEDCAKHFLVSAEALLAGMVTKVQVTQRTLEVFTGQLMLDFKQADIAPAELARRAQEVLLKNDLFSAKELRKLLVTRLRSYFKQEGMGGHDNQAAAAAFLNAMLVAQPGVLAEAQKKAIAERAQEVDAAELPESYEFEQPVTQSMRNIYGIYPPGLNTWELAFAQNLDAAPGNIVQWWHRNEPHKPHSVNLMLASGKQFFPDFVIGVEGRSKLDGVLLADPKLMWEMEKEHDKVLAEHPKYGRALILTKPSQFGWHTIVWDSKQKRPALGSAWNWQDAAGW